MLLSAIIVHGFSPTNFCTTTVPISVPDARDSDSYSGISLSSIFVKISDHIALQKYHDHCFVHIRVAVRFKSCTFHQNVYHDLEE